MMTIEAVSIANLSLPVSIRIVATRDAAEFRKAHDGWLAVIRESAISSLWTRDMREAVEPRAPSVIRSAWERVFLSNDPFAWPFKPEFEAGRMFYPTDGYHLTKEQFTALRRALEMVGERCFLLSIVEGEGMSFLERHSGHWECSSSAHESYRQLPLGLENAIYSPQGTFGVLISHEMHAIIAGSPQFMAAISGQYQGWSNDLRLLRETWSNNPNAGWLEPAIRRMSSA